MFMQPGSTPAMMPGAGRAAQAALQARQMAAGPGQAQASMGQRNAAPGRPMYRQRMGQNIARAAAFLLRNKLRGQFGQGRGIPGPGQRPRYLPGQNPMGSMMPGQQPPMGGAY